MMMNQFFQDKSVLVTGGTGTFGQAFTKNLMAENLVRKIIVFSRDEMKQWKMQQDIDDPHDKLRFFIGDVRDYQRLVLAFMDVDIVVHAAATKIVPVAEYNPLECVKTNINGATNVINASLNTNVEKVVALSTDKASSPINLYGATKLVSDKLFISANNYSGNSGRPKFSIVRYGNVMGSRGSVIPYFLSLNDNEDTPITDARMTRFMITIEQGIQLVKLAAADSVGGEIYVKKIPSMNIIDIAKAIRPKSEIRMVGVRPGEKIHEQMIGIEDSQFTYEYKDYYKILPSINQWYEDPFRVGDGVPVGQEFEYQSGTNPTIMTREELCAWIKANSASFLNV